MSDMDMVEMVAAAIGNCGHDTDWDDCLEFARAAIEAMREPTEAMKHCSLRFLSADLDYDEMYRRMIDAALEKST